MSVAVQDNNLAHCRKIFFFCLPLHNLERKRFEKGVLELKITEFLYFFKLQFY